MQNDDVFEANFDAFPEDGAAAAQDWASGVAWPSASAPAAAGGAVSTAASFEDLVAEHADPDYVNLPAKRPEPASNGTGAAPTGFRVPDFAAAASAPAAAPASAPAARFQAEDEEHDYVNLPARQPDPPAAAADFPVAADPHGLSPANPFKSNNPFASEDNEDEEAVTDLSFDQIMAAVNPESSSKPNKFNPFA